MADTDLLVVSRDGVNYKITRAELDTYLGAGYEIENSLRFNASDSAYMSRTPTVSGNLKTWTWSGWVKRGTLSTLTSVFDATGSGIDVYHNIRFYANDTLTLTLDNTGTVSTTAVFRDPSAWYHVVVVMDTTQSTSTDRVKIYVNGDLQTVTGVFPALNEEGNINSANQHSFGRYINGNTQYYDGYLAEVNLIDGQALTASDFGKTNDDGVWIPKAYTGTYGTNGFYLQANDSADLGKDTSGNNNNFTNTNVEQVTDVPMLTNENTANFCTLNPLSAGGTAPINANLSLLRSGINFGAVGTIGVSSGKWYFETQGTSPYWLAGVTTLSYLPYGINPANVGSQALAVYSATGNKYDNGSATAYGASYATNNIMAIALDLDAGTITFYKNGVSQGVAFTGLSGTYFPVLGGPDGYNVGNINFGQQPFAYTPPTGFKKLNTFNLPDPTIKDGSKYFDTVLYTGNGTTQSITGVGFQPDWTWIKERNGVADHGLYDAVRGVEKDLVSDTTGAETTQSTGLTSFDSDGFTTGDLAKLNTNNDTYVAWNWKAGGSAVLNEEGTINSQVLANPTAGFSVVTYGGNSTSGATVGHGLGVVPDMVIVKNRTGSSGFQNWGVYHSSLLNTQAVFLNTAGPVTASTTYWNNTTPTASVFSLGYTGTDGWNITGQNFVTYCFAEVEGYSKFGSYNGNGNANGPFIYTGFKPAFVMAKRTDGGGGGWLTYDNERDTYNLTTQYLLADTSGTEVNGVTRSPDIVMDLLSNGFKWRGGGNTGNVANDTNIYMAFAENPFKNSTAR